MIPGRPVLQASSDLYQSSSSTPEGREDSFYIHSWVHVLLEFMNLLGNLGDTEHKNDQFQEKEFKISLPR